MGLEIHSHAVYHKSHRGASKSHHTNRYECDAHMSVVRIRDERDAQLKRVTRLRVPWEIRERG